MTKTIRLFVGTDPAQSKADRMLENSVRRNTKGDVDITWMRHGEGQFDGWNIGREPGKPKSGGWGTDFACFRMAVPELMDYQGIAIYLDCDMIVLGDLQELLDQPRANPILCNSAKIMDVMVIDCEEFAGKAWWPPIRSMKTSSTSLGYYRHLLGTQGMVDTTLSHKWNCRDYCEANMKLLHFSEVATQPWKPFPKFLDYKPHPCNEALVLWESYA